jgi:hypothetical protein
MNNQELKKEIVKRLDVIEISKPPFLGTSERDKLDYIGRHFGGFLQAMKKSGAIANWMIGIDINTRNTKAAIHISLKGNEKDPFIYPVNMSVRGIYA